MASPTVTSARSGPAYSRIMASCTMVSSRCVAGLSTGQPTALGHDDDEEGPQGEQPLRRGHRPGVGQGGADDGREVRRAGGCRQRQDGDEQRRLGQGADGDGPARPHTAESRAGVKARQRQQRRSHEQEVDEDEEVRAGCPSAGWVVTSGAIAAATATVATSTTGASGKIHVAWSGRRRCLRKSLRMSTRGWRTGGPTRPSSRAPHLAHDPRSTAHRAATTTTWTHRGDAGADQCETVLTPSPPVRPT